MDEPIRVLVAKPGLDGHDRGAKIVAARAARRRHGGDLHAACTRRPRRSPRWPCRRTSTWSGSRSSPARTWTSSRACASCCTRRRGARAAHRRRHHPGRGHAELERRGIGRLFGPGARLNEIVDYIRAEMAAAARPRGATEMACASARRRRPHARPRDPQHRRGRRPPRRQHQDLQQGAALEGPAGRKIGPRVEVLAPGADRLGRQRRTSRDFYRDAGDGCRARTPRRSSAPHRGDGRRAHRGAPLRRAQARRRRRRLLGGRACDAGDRSSRPDRGAGAAPRHGARLRARRSCCRRPSRSTREHALPAWRPGARWSSSGCSGMPFPEEYERRGRGLGLDHAGGRGARQGAAARPR